MHSDILSLRVVGENGYMLNETVENINEAVATESIKSVLTTVLMAMLDDGTGELSGFVALVPGYVANTIQLYFTNRKVEKELKNPNPNKETIQKLQNDLLRDVKDILRLLLIASPIPVADGVLAGSLELLDKKTITISYEMLTEFLKEKIPKFGLVEKILTFGGNAIGFGIINSAVNNIGLINNYIDRGDINIDATSGSENKELPLEDDDFDNDNRIHNREDLLRQLSESRWQVLSGIN